MSETVEAPSEGTVEEFAVVEVFGHRRLVGRIQEVEKFGTKLLRIDLPNEGDFAKGFVSQLYGGRAIFSVTPCTAAYVEREHKPYRAAGLLAPPPEMPDDDEESEYEP